MSGILKYFSVKRKQENKTETENEESTEAEPVGVANAAPISSVELPASQELEDEPKQKKKYRYFLEKHQPKANCVQPWVSGGRNHLFRDSWYESHPWLHYDTAEKAMFCFECTAAIHEKAIPAAINIEPAFTSSGFQNYKKAPNKFVDHESSSLHRAALMRHFNPEKDSVLDQVLKYEQKIQESNRRALKIIFSSVQYLACQGLALRNKTEEDGHLYQLLELRRKDNADLDSFLKRKKNFTSPKIINEINKLLSHHTLREVLKSVKEFSFQNFSLIIDESEDVSTKEQVSITLRFVNDDFEPVEIFLGFYEVVSTTAENLLKVVEDALSRYNYSLSDARGQCYDGARNMKGSIKGLKTRILQIQPLAVYIHCSNHSLNLALQDTAKENLFIKNILSWCNELGKLVKDSPKRLALYQSSFTEMRSQDEDDLMMVMDSDSDIDDENDEDSDDVDEIATADHEQENQACSNANKKKLVNPKIKIKAAKPVPLCPTRWTVRINSIRGVLNNYEVVLDFLQKLSDSKEPISATANGLFAQLTKGETCFGLLLCEELFEPCEKLSLILQRETSTVLGAKSAVDTVLNSLKKLIKDDDRSFDVLWEKTKAFCTEFEIPEPQKKRQIRLPARYREGISSNSNTNTNEESEKDYYKKIYTEVINLLISEIEYRFEQEGFDRVLELENFLLDNSSTSDKNKGTAEEKEAIKKKEETVLGSYGINRKSLKSELTTLRNSQLEQAKPFSCVADIGKFLKNSKPEVRKLFPNVATLVKLLMVVPATSSTAERSFSMLRFLKTYLTNRMNAVTLNNRSMCHFYRNVCRSLDLENVIEDFVSLNDLRRKTFGCGPSASTK